MVQLRNRISELRAFKFALLSGKVKSDPVVLPAAIDWLENAIVEHERDLDKLVAAA